MNIAVDFDGTVVEHKYPAVGPTLPGSVETLKRIVAQGHNIILWTMRDKKELEDAVSWYKQNDIPLFGINQNPEQDWSTSPKAYAHLYIDDAALGCPLISPPPIMVTAKDGKTQVPKLPRPYVDWIKVEAELLSRGIIQPAHQVGV